MRLLRALLVLLLALAVIVPLAAWLVPPRLDMNRWRADFASAASARLGRSVTIGGHIALELLPEPMLTASDIAVGGGEAIGFTAAHMRLRLALGPLLFRDDLDYQKPAAAHMTPALFVNENMRLEVAFRLMQRAGHRLAIVLARDGAETGVVSLEDILKVMFGEMKL